MILYLGVSSVIVALLRGGSIRRLGDLDIRQMWLIFVPPALIALLVIARKLGYVDAVDAASGWLHLLSYCALLTVVLLNRRLAGAKLLILGLALNILVLTANSGRMPVSYQAARWARTSPRNLKVILDDRMERHCLMSERTRLNYLADVIPVPSPPFPSSEVMSVGDSILAVGVFVMIQAAMLSGKRKEAAASGEA